MTFAAGQFLAVDDRGTLVASADGNAWVNRSLSVGTMGAIAFGNGIYVAVGGALGWIRGLNISISTNAFNWTHPNTPEVYKNLYGVVYGAGQFVAVGECVLFMSKRRE